MIQKSSITTPKLEMQPMPVTRDNFTMNMMEKIRPTYDVDIIQKLSYGSTVGTPHLKNAIKRMSSFQSNTRINDGEERQALLFQRENYADNSIEARAEYAKEFNGNIIEKSIVQWSDISADIQLKTNMASSASMKNVKVEDYGEIKKRMSWEDHYIKRVRDI